MGPFGLFTLLGLGLLFVVTDTGDTDTGADTPDDPTAPDAPTPDEIQFTGETLGTDGPDRFIFGFEDTEGLQFDLGGGSDIVQAGRGDDLISGGAGEDFLRGGSGDDVVYGGEGDDVLESGSGNDLISGGDGNDTLENRGGDSTIFGGAGDDVIFTTPGQNIVDAGQGNDTIRFGSGATVTGGDGADAFAAGYSRFPQGGPAIITDFDPEEDRISGLRLALPTGSEGGLTVQDNIDGTGVDFIVNGQPFLTILGAQASDFDELLPFYSIAEGITATGSDGDDLITVARGATANGGAGDDYIYFSGPFAGPESSFLNGDAGSDTLLASGPTVFDNPDGTGTQTVRSFVDGGEGDDLVGALYSGILTGGEGTDTFAILDPLTSSEVSLITDFDGATETLLIDDSSVTPDSLALIVWDNNMGSDLYANGRLIARITGGQSLTPADIALGTPAGLLP